MTREASSGNPFAEVLKETLALSKQVQAGQGADPEGEQVVERAEGLIRVTASAAGEIRIDLDPKVMRLGSEVLGHELSGAVNESLAALNEQRLAAQHLDLDAINEQVEALQEQASAQLNNFMDGILRAHQAAGEAGPDEARE
jgi:DNA-binding protein YbaB